ncbi:M91 family zinc metallopeptidase [Pseudomonas khavaziana]|uniref:M91 family zinc metallopeptidase n=1 Tax=Pseudomonas khavaziana TaxID=2842351 RepID=A0ABZ2D9T5_9PSED
MLFPLTYLATVYSPAAPSKPSPFDPPPDLTPGTIDRRTHLLHADGDTQISRIIEWDSSPPNDPQIVGNWLYIETGDHADHIHVRSYRGDKLQILINGKAYLFETQEGGHRQALWIETRGGNDSVVVDDDVKLTLDVEGGDGDDDIQAGGGRSRLYGGKGKDLLRLGSGLGYAAGNEDDDTLIGGSGNSVLYGNQGKDALHAGLGPSTKQSYLDGGDDEDRLFAGSGHNVLHGGNGDDHLVGYDRTSFYTGKGNDAIWNNRPEDRIYAGATDYFDRSQGSVFTQVNPSNAGDRGFTVQDGTHGFKQQVADDFEFLRSSPIGQQALDKMDELAVRNGGTVSVEQGGGSETAYLFGSTELDNMAPQVRATIDDTRLGVIKDGVPGSRADRARLFYAHPSILESADRTNTMVPVTGLFHEIAHAYNGATGTFLAGESIEQLESGAWNLVSNDELQAIGRRSRATPYDFDNDPSTPPDTINPKPFTENELNEEMGKPLRKSYNFDLSDQGNGA